jgi:hypothetical protein
LNKEIIEKEEEEGLKYNKYSYLNIFVKNKVIKNYDYSLVDYDTWNMLQMMYGGTEIKRKV